MRLYDGRLGTFIPQATSAQIADILRTRFIDRFDHKPSDEEVKSWKNSLGVPPSESRITIVPQNTSSDYLHSWSLRLAEYCSA